MINDAFSRLQAEAAADATGAAASNFWRAVYELPEWHFLQVFPADGSQPVGPQPFGSPQPMTVRLEGKLLVAAFTSSDRAFAAAKDNNLIHPQFGIPILKIARDNAANMLCRMNQGSIDGVLFNFNKGEQGFFAPLGNVAPMFEWHLDRIPPAMFDAFVKGVVASNARHAWARLHRRLALMDRWLLIGDTKRPQAPQLYDYEGSPTLLLFTDEDHVVRGAGVAGGADTQGHLPLIPTTPLDAATFAEKIAAHSGDKVREVLFNLGTEPFILQIKGMKDMVEQYLKPARPVA